MELTSTLILANAQDKIFELAYKISKKINLDLVKDEVIQGYYLTSISRVYNSTVNLTAAQKLQLLSGLKTVTNITL